MKDPTLLVRVVQERSYLVGGFAVALCALYFFVMRVTGKPPPRGHDHETGSGARTRRLAANGASRGPEVPSIFLYRRFAESVKLGGLWTSSVADTL